MTANKNEQGSEPDRPAWATGLDLSPESGRVSDYGLTEWVTLFQGNTHAVLRRLADAEMRVAELEQELADKREAMARVLDAYQVQAASPGRAAVISTTSLLEVQANGLGNVVRAALHHAKGGDR